MYDNFHIVEMPGDPQYREYGLYVYVDCGHYYSPLSAGLVYGFYYLELGK